MKFPLTIAYNMTEKKIGCALAQPILGATFSGGEVTANFDTDRWELNPAKCQLYKVNNKQEFDRIVEITHAAGRKKKSKTI